jgi:nucleotide-binding universal stress UspA family protein
MYNKILVAIDGSELSNKALETALQIAKNQQAKLEILYVGKENKSSIALGAITASLMFTGYIPAEFLPGYLAEEIEKEGKEILSKAQFKAKRFGIEACTIYLEGNPSQKITEFAQENDYNLLIVGDQRMKEKKRKFNNADKISYFSNRHVLSIY